MKEPETIGILLFVQRRKEEHLLQFSSESLFHFHHIICINMKIETCKSEASLRKFSQAVTLLSGIQEMPGSSLWLWL
jgi:hypothetical protein